MSSKSKDFVGVQSKEKGRKRAFKSIYKCSDALDDKVDPYKCKKRPWSEEEDQLVIKLVSEYGPQKWTFIATHLDGRIGKQCRERWHNHLNPNIKKYSWSEEEEWILYLFHRGIGNKWAEIAKYILGRTDNSIKNHWNSGMKKRLDDYGRKLANVRDIFGEVGESYFNRVTVAGEKKALEILLLNKQYVPSDCDDEEEEEEDQELEQEEDFECSQDKNVSTNNNAITNNTRNSTTVKKDKSSKEELDGSQKTKEKCSVISKTQINPFTWSLNDEEQLENNASTQKKALPVPQLVKHSVSLQPYHLITKQNLNKDQKFIPQENSSELAQNGANTIIPLRENRSEMNLREVKKSVKQGISSLNEDPKKKVKIEEHSPNLSSVAEKQKKNVSKKENQPILQSVNQQVIATSKVGKRKTQASSSEVVSIQQSCDVKSKEEESNNGKIANKGYANGNDLNTKESQHLPNKIQYSDNEQQPIPQTQYSSNVPSNINSNDDKQFTSQIYDNYFAQYGAYPSAYHPYPMQNGQQYSSFPPPPPPHQQIYPTTVYMGAPHPSTLCAQVNPNATPQYGQQYKFDKHYYPHYGSMNFMYYPLHDGSSVPSGQQYGHQQHPYYREYYGSKQMPVTGQPILNYTSQNGNQHLNMKNPYPYPLPQQSTQNYPLKQTLSLQKTQSVPLQLGSQQQYTSESHGRHEIMTSNRQEKKQGRNENIEDQPNPNDLSQTFELSANQNKRENVNNSSVSQRQSSATINDTSYLDSHYSQQQQQQQSSIHHQGKYLNSLNSSYKYKQIDCSPFQMNRTSPNSDSLCTDENEGVNDLESHKKGTSHISTIEPIYGGTNHHHNHTLAMIHANLNGGNQGQNYESPSKMLNLSEKIMLKTVSSNKFNMHHLNSNIKYPIQRQTLHPLNLNSLFNQEEDYFNENNIQNNN